MYSIQIVFDKSINTNLHSSDMKIKYQNEMTVSPDSPDLQVCIIYADGAKNKHFAARLRWIMNS